MSWICLLRRLLLLLLLLPGPAPAGADFAARLSSAPAAMEYWDFTAWFDTGERFSARFLVTNQGPGTRTAAAVGHLLLPNGDVVPISYGRLSDRWILSDDRRRLKIASAVLDMRESVIRVEVDSDKHGVKIAFEIPLATPIAFEPIPGAYAVDVLMATTAKGQYWLRGMTKTSALNGLAALTHTAMEKSEAEMVVRRAELFARIDQTALYVSDVTLTDGARRQSVVRKEGDATQIASDPTVSYAEIADAVSDAGYRVAHRWAIAAPPLTAVASLRREYLRWDPLEILPQPFRLLVALRGAPRRVWCDAEIETSESSRGNGVAVVTFSKPGTLQ